MLEWFYICFGVIVLSSVFGIFIGIAMAVTGQKNRGWESPYSLVARDSLSLLWAILTLQGYQHGFFGDLAANLILILPGFFSGAYILWNDREYAYANGREWPMNR